jgi:hypothetical protein
MDCDMKKLKIGVCIGCWTTNIGNAFCNFGAEAALRLAFPNAEIFQIGDAVHWMFKTSARHHNIPYIDGNSLEIGEVADVDVLVFSGMCMCEEFVENNGITFIKAAKRGVAVMLLGAGAALYTQKEAEIFSEFLGNIGNYSVITRDDDTFNLFRDKLKNISSGIDSAFFTPDYYKPPKLCINPYDIVNFDSGESAPHISHKVDHIIYTHHDLWGIFKKAYLTQPNTLISDIPQDYLSLYSQVNETHSNRVHACIASLAYGNKARLYNATRRNTLFNKVNAFEITEKPTSLDIELLKDLKNSQVLKTRSMIENMLGL